MKIIDRSQLAPGTFWVASNFHPEPAATENEIWSPASFLGSQLGTDIISFGRQQLLFWESEKIFLVAVNHVF